jgi:protease YdgD
VLTAAHCLWNKRTGAWLPPCALHFVLGYQRSGFLAHSLVVSYKLEGEHLPEANPARPELARDWAVLTLARDLSTVAKPIPVGPLDPERLGAYKAKGGTFVQAGYSRDRAHILSRHDNCSLAAFASSGRLVLHACDATFGDSGSPILLLLDDTYRIVAMHLATTGQDPAGIALAGSVFYERLQHQEPPAPEDGTFKACDVQSPLAPAARLAATQPVRFP